MEGVQPVLYETRYHATGLYSPDSSPQLSEGDGWGISSFLPSRGLKKIQEKWRGSILPKSLKNEVTVFVSPDAEFVAVAVRNQITFVQKDDKYIEPCGFYTGSKRRVTFTHGAWSDSCALLALLDENSNFYVVKPNGVEILEVTKGEFKLSAPAVGLFVLDCVDSGSSYMCAFHILSSDGLVYRIEFNQELIATVPHTSLSTNQDILKKHYPLGPLCLDFHQGLSFLVLSGAAGSHKGAGCSLSVWHVSRVLDLQLLSFIQYEGFLCNVGNTEEPLTAPKVVISPQGKHIAALDLVGNLNIFNLDVKKHSLSLFAFGDQCYKVMGFSALPGGRKCINEITDMVWWSDSALVIRKRGGIVTMVDVNHGVKLLETDLVFSSPILGRVTRYEGFVFLLDSNLVVKDSGQIIYDGCKQEVDRKEWTLVSLCERSVLEMYKILVDGMQYDAALKFAERHTLNTDEVFKAQWLSSGQGTDDISRFLYNVKDISFVLSQCINTFGPTEEAAKGLLLYGLHITDKYRFSETEDIEGNTAWDYRILRLQLLQNRDRLDTFLGINMGRYSMHDYVKFQGLPLNKVAISLAEGGKIGAINLLFKRHLYSISPFILEILGSIPETIPVQTYSQLLPGRSPPCNITLREKDWVEGDKMVAFVQSNSQFQNTGSVMTEHIIKQLHECPWPSVSELSQWYINRAVDIDSLSGQVENCLSLLDVGCRKGLLELQQFYDDALCFYNFVFSGAHSDEKSINMSLVSWKQLSDYEKFKVMLERVKEDTVLETLKTKSIPFMQKKKRQLATSIGGVETVSQTTVDIKQDSLLVRWLKDIAAENKLEILLSVIDEGCKSFENDFFMDEKEAIEVVIDSLYLCKLTDKWNIMASILSKVSLMSLSYKAPADNDLSPRQGMQGFGSPVKDDKTLTMLPISIPLKGRVPDTSIENLERRVKQAEGHVESGRLLAYYQVPKPLHFFLEAHSDEKGVKQILRLILSKFGRRQPMRSDNEWANMWSDMLCLQEKAFPFLDSEYMLLEFCRGLLKAGKFSLARNYLKGIGTTSLASEKAEYLVVQAAREYFFSASSLDCSEIWRAKECLSLFPNSRTVRAEMDIIDALTINLPNLGVALLPMQYRQIGNPMEIVNMVITSPSAAYLNIDEILEVARLLGLHSPDDIAAVQETVARESAVAGDLELAFDLCLVLAKKGHGSIWDLCAAMGRGNTVENMSISSRKELLGFSLSHCDEESVLELLQAWKDLDMQSQCEKLVVLTGIQPPKASSCGSSLAYPVYTAHNMLSTKGFPADTAENNSSSVNESLEQHGELKRLFHGIAKEVPLTSGSSCTDLMENSKFLSFATSQLPWLLDLINSKTYDTISTREPHTSVSFQAVKTIISWLVKNNIVPSDDIIVSLAKPFTHLSAYGEGLDGCLYLLNLLDAFHGVEVIEEKMRSTKGYQHISRISDLGMLYGLLQNSASHCLNPTQRRNLLLHTFHGRDASISPGEIQKIDSVQSTFWREWKAKLEEQKNMADQARSLEKIIPGIETSRFLSGDKSYVRNALFTFIESVRREKKQILQDALNLADTYGIHQIEVLLHFVRCSLVSDIWSEDDIEAEISDFKKDLLHFPSKVIHMLLSNVYPEIDGHNKQRLSYLYSILSDCCLQLGEVESASLGLDVEHSSQNLGAFYKVLEQECKRVSIINGLNFKNIAGLAGLNFGQLNAEVCTHLNESSVEALAQMVDALGGYSGDSLLLTRKDVYKHLVVCLMEDLENGIEVNGRISSDDFRVFIFELEKNYERCSKYMREILERDLVDMHMRYFARSLPSSPSSISADVLGWQDCLVLLLNLWIRLADNLHEMIFQRECEIIHSKWKTLSRCLTVLMMMVLENNLTSNVGWKTIFAFVEDGCLSADVIDVLEFSKSMLFAGCGFRAVADLFVQTRSESQAKAYPVGNINHAESEMTCFYRKLIESLLSELSSGCDVGQRMQLLISSLSKQVESSADLKRVRHTVWEALYVFSENMQVPSMYRVYALELLQSVTGKKEGSHHSQMILIQPWEGWAESCSPVISESVEPCSADAAGMSRKFANTVVALKSNEIISTAWPGVEITPNDLTTVQSAVSCFSYLTTSAVSETHIHSLQHLLGEWEGLFSCDENLEGQHDKTHATGSNWTADGWDDSWERFENDPVVYEDKTSSGFSVHPLHACWRIVLLKLVGLSHFSDVVKCIDHSLVHPKTILLDEDEARELNMLLLSIDSFVALKVALLLPYQSLWFDCLPVVDAKLMEDQFWKVFGRDYAFLVLMLSSGIVSTVMSDSRYNNLASYLCYLVGFFAHLHQEHQSCSFKPSGTTKGTNESYMFGEIIFPHFIAELVKAKQYLPAGVFVLKFMHAHSSMSLINVAESSIGKFIMCALERSRKEELSIEEKPVISIVNSVIKLRDKLPNSLESALFSLSTDVK